MACAYSYVRRSGEVASRRLRSKTPVARQNESHVLACPAMRSNIAFTSAAVVALIAGSAGEAEARGAFRSLVPNGFDANCQTCHVNANGGPPWNAFGMDVMSRLTDGQPDWERVRDLDSDNDGQTNAQELGDPCGTWMPGMPAPRGDNISRPGDPASTSAMPDSPSCDDPDAGFPDMGVMDVGFEDAGMANPDATMPVDVGFSPPVDAGFTPDPEDMDGEDDGGCSCSTNGNQGSSVWGFLMLGAIMFALRRRR